MTDLVLFLVGQAIAILIGLINTIANQLNALSIQLQNKQDRE